MKHKKTVLAICLPLAALLLVLVAYVLYVLLAYYRVEDNLALEVSGKGEGAVPIGEELTLMTYNVGFGAYSADYSFFMDGGEHARAYSEKAVRENIGGAIETVLAAAPDLVLLQEVDVKGTRSHGVDQVTLFREALPDFDGVFGQNYDSPYFFYPFHEPIGANRSGVLTLSRFAISEATRRSLPVEDSLYKLIDLDRAYTVSRLETANDRSFVLYNVHLSAYTSDGSIANEQLRLLGEDMRAEQEKGNYVIAAGDFNKDLLGDSGEFFDRPEGIYNWAQPLDSSLLPEGVTCHSGENAPTCRNADAPYVGDGSDFVLSVDGFLIGEGVELIACETVDVGFAYSDHNPVRLAFRLVE